MSVQVQQLTTTTRAAARRHHTLTPAEIAKKEIARIDQQIAVTQQRINDLYQQRIDSNNAIAEREALFREEILAGRNGDKESHFINIERQNVLGIGDAIDWQNGQLKDLQSERAGFERDLALADYERAAVQVAGELRTVFRAMYDLQDLIAQVLDGSHRGRGFHGFNLPEGCYASDEARATQELLGNLDDAAARYLDLHNALAVIEEKQPDLMKEIHNDDE